MKGHIHRKSFRTNNFEKFYVTVIAIDSWNKMQGCMGEITLKDLRPSKIKWLRTRMEGGWSVEVPLIMYGFCSNNIVYSISLSLALFIFLLTPFDT